MNEISVSEFEAKVLAQEEIVLKIRASAGTKVLDYTYIRKAAGNTSVTDWLDGRIKPLINGLEIAIIDGDYATPHGRTKLETLRNGYAK